MFYEYQRVTDCLRVCVCVCVYVCVCLFVPSIYTGCSKLWVFDACLMHFGPGTAWCKAPMNPMLMMAQMMLETQKKLKEAQEKMMKVQARQLARPSCDDVT